MVGACGCRSLFASGQCLFRDELKHVSVLGFVGLNCKLGALCYRRCMTIC